MRKLVIAHNERPRPGLFSVRVDQDRTSARGIRAAVSRPPASCPTTEPVIETPGAVKRAVNELMRGNGLQRWSETERIAFFCECEQQACYQAVWLTCREYDLSRASPRWVALIDEHRSQATP